jgi:hypothetical protein
MRAIRRIEILIAKRKRILFDMAVGIDDAHEKLPPENVVAKSLYQASPSGKPTVESNRCAGTCGYL